MIDSDLELHVEKAEGKPLVKEGPGDHPLCRKGKILTLTSHEALDCGLAVGEADDLAELGDALGMGKWTEIKGLATPLAESLPKRAETFKGAMAQIIARFQAEISSAASFDPSQSVTTVTRVAPRVAPRPIGPQPVGPGFPGRRYPSRPYSGPQQTVTVVRNHSPLRWKSDSLACVVSLQQAEGALTDGISLCEAYGRGSEVQLLTEAMQRISAIRSTIYDDRNKYGSTQSVAVDNPPTAFQPNPVRARPAATNRSVASRLPENRTMRRVRRITLHVSQHARHAAGRIPIYSRLVGSKACGAATPATCRKTDGAIAGQCNRRGCERGICGWRNGGRQRCDQRGGGADYLRWI